MVRPSQPAGDEPLLKTLRLALPDRTTARDGASSDPSPSSLVMAFSGGVDSSALLHALAALRTDIGYSLRAIHVNHQLHADASDWSARCRTMCDALDVDLAVVAVDVDTGSPLGIEAAARDARHAALVANSDEDDCLVLAQHRDDQAETVLLRLLRGSGSQGLSAMQTYSQRDGRRLWRPWLAHSRTEINDYARRHRIQGIDDPANADPRFARSLLRHQVMPLLRQHWPGADISLTRSATILGDEANRLAARDREQLALAQGVDPDTLSLSVLQGFPSFDRHSVLRAWIADRQLPPTPARVMDRVQTELLDANESGNPELRWANVCLRRYRDLLYLDTDVANPPDKNHNADSTNPSVPWNGLRPVDIAPDWRLRFGPALNAPLPLRVAPRQGGERLRQANARQHQTVQHLLQALGVPPWKRSSLPLLWIDAHWLERVTGYPAGAADEHLLAVANLLRSEALTQLERYLDTRLTCSSTLDKARRNVAAPD